MTVTATHILVENFQVLHVIGKRLEVLWLLEKVHKQGDSLGVDLPMAVRQKNGNFRVTQMWFALSSIRMVSDEHDIEVEEGSALQVEENPVAPVSLEMAI